MVGTTSIECRAPRLDEWFRVRLGVERGASWPSATPARALFTWSRETCRKHCSRC